MFEVVDFSSRGFGRVQGRGLLYGVRIDGGGDMLRIVLNFGYDRFGYS